MMFVYGGVGKDQKLLEDMNVLHIPDVKIDRSKLSTEMDEAELAAMHEAAAKAKDGLAQQINQNLYVITISLSLSLSLSCTHDCDHDHDHPWNPQILGKLNEETSDI